jgi:hypothetical protein
MSSAMITKSVETFLNPIYAVITDNNPKNVLPFVFPPDDMSDKYGKHM